MKLVDYREKLLKELRDPDYAAGVLEEVIADGDHKALLLTLRDIIEAQGGMGRFAKHVSISRQSLYKILSEDGNPTLSTLQEILKALGLRIAIAVDESGEAA